jgi:hypothetical protein
MYFLVLDGKWKTLLLPPHEYTLNVPLFQFPIIWPTRTNKATYWATSPMASRSTFYRRSRSAGPGIERLHQRNDLDSRTSICCILHGNGLVCTEKFAICLPSWAKTLDLLSFNRTWCFIRSEYAINAQMYREGTTEIDGIIYKGMKKFKKFFIPLYNIPLLV